MKKANFRVQLKFEKFNKAIYDVCVKKYKKKTLIFK